MQGSVFNRNGKRKISLAVWSEYPLVSRGLRAALALEDDIELVNDADRELKRRELGAAYDLLVMTPPLHALDAVLAVQNVVERIAPAGSVVLTPDLSEELALQLFRIGARGVLPLSAGTTEVVTAVRRVAHSGLYVMPALQECFAADHARPPAAAARALSLRETQVLRLIALGHTHPEIAEALSIAVKTVDTHRANLLRKLKLRNNADLTRHAVRARLIRLD